MLKKVQPRASDLRVTSVKMGWKLPWDLHGPADPQTPLGKEDACYTIPSPLTSLLWAVSEEARLCFSSIHSDKVKIQLAEKLLELCHLQKNRIMWRPLIIKGNSGNNSLKMAASTAVLPFGNCRGHFVTWMPFSSLGMSDYIHTDWHRKTPLGHWAYYPDLNILDQIRLVPETSVSEAEQLPIKKAWVKCGLINEINAFTWTQPRDEVLFNNHYWVPN